MKTLTQERAEFALNEVKGKDKKYATYAKRVPALITTNGLIPTLAFLNSKNESREVYNSLRAWLEKRGYINNGKDALEKLVEVDSSTLRLAIIEALSFANWLKRMAEIEIDENKE